MSTHPLHTLPSSCPVPPPAPPTASYSHREFEVGAVRQELAALLSSVQLLREGNPGRKIAEIQGKLATVPLRPLCPLRSAEGPRGSPTSRSSGSQSPCEVGAPVWSPHMLEVSSR